MPRVFEDSAVYTPHVNANTARSEFLDLAHEFCGYVNRTIHCNLVFVYFNLIKILQDSYRSILYLNICRK